MQIRFELMSRAHDSQLVMIIQDAHFLLRTLRTVDLSGVATRNSRSQTALTVVDRAIGLLGGAFGLLFQPR